MMLGKGTIMGVSGYITVLIIKYNYTDVQQPFLPAIFVCMVAYVVGSLFLSIFSFSCTAILHCFIMCEDQNLNIEAPESLKSFLDHNDKDAKPAAEKKADDGAKDDGAKADGEQPNEMKSWTIFDMSN